MSESEEGDWSDESEVSSTSWRPSNEEESESENSSDEEHINMGPTKEGKEIIHINEKITTALNAERKRMEERNRHQSMEEQNQNLVLDSSDPILVDSGLVAHLKPHQRDGVRFMWSHCYQSIDKLNRDQKGSGCILAHCMGLGMLQVTII